jgi:hypothetical protein
MYIINEQWMYRRYIMNDTFSVSQNTKYEKNSLDISIDVTIVTVGFSKSTYVKYPFSWTYHIPVAKSAAPISA